MSTTPDRSLDPQQVIADLERKLAERTAERDEALEQQTATAEVLGVINSSPGDLTPVFDAVLEKAIRLCEAVFGTLWTYDGDRYLAVALRNVPPVYAEFLREPLRVPPGTVVGQLAAGKQVAQIADIAAAEYYERGGIAHPAHALGGFRTVLGVALRKDAALLGAITIYRQEVRPFSEKQIALLQNFAAQAVIAMENARLITETREALEKQIATAEVLGVINSSPGDLAPVFDAILERAHTLCGATQGSLLVHDGGHFRAVATHGLPEEFARMVRQPFPTEAGTAYERLLQGESLVHIRDLAAREQTSPIGRAAVEICGVRTLLFVPLRKDDVLLGCITAYRQEVRPFTDKQIALLQNFAAQAVIAMENARLISETREALEQQTATAEVLGVINASPGDLAPVFKEIVEKAVKLCGAAEGALRTFDGKLFHLVAVVGAAPDAAERIRQLGPIQGGLYELIARGEPVVQVADVRETDDYRNDPASRERIDLRNIRTWLAVALQREGAVLGAILVHRQEVRPFSDKQITLLENFAAQAVIAMENARLITETREALEQQTATAEVLQVINSSPGDLAPVFASILEKAHTLCGAADGTLFLRDGERLRAVAIRGGVPEPFAERLREGFVAADVPVSAPLLSGKPFVHIPDLALVDHPMARAGVEISRTRTLISVPLRKGDELLGMIVGGRKEVRPFTEKQITLLQNFAAQAVIAMENARLLTETREALEQQTATAEVLQVINASPGDLAPVFDVMLGKAMRLCEAAIGELCTYDGERFTTAAIRGETLAYIEARAMNPAAARPGTGSRRVIETKRPLHILDMQIEAQNRPAESRALIELSGVRTSLTIPLLRDETFLGFIRVYRREVKPFTDQQIALLENFAAQAVIAMENARLITETREALEQQTATAEVLGVINSSPGDLAPVFDAILEKAHSLCGVAFGFLQLYDSGKLRAVAVRGVPESVAAVLRQPIEPTPGLPPARLLDGERIVQEADMAALVADGRGGPRAESIIENGVRTALFVPLRKDANFLGCIAAFRKEVRPFTDKQIALLQNFAEQAVVAMENARLLIETREALEQQTATAEVLQVINSSPGDLAPVFDAILEKALNLCEAACGHLYRYDGEFLHPMAMRGEARYIEFLRQRGAARLPEGSPTPIMRVISSGEYVQVPDCREDECYRLSERFRAQADAGGWRSALCVPLRKDAAVVGTITVFRQEVQPFTDKQIALLQNFAAQAAIAMENARLLGELRQRTDEVGELNRGLEARVAEQVDELGRVGRLKRFLAPQLAELIVSHGDEKILESHRREIVVVFCDLRGYTAFTETAEPEEVLDFLRQYHGALGPLVSQYEGTLDQFSGDGIMVFFNDPVLCADPAERAVKMAVAMREAAGTLIAAWRRRGRMLGFGAGIAQGYATLGQIGFADRSGYTAIGTVCNLAARLCAEAKDGQILVAQRVAVAVEETVPLEEVGELTLKGLTQPVVAYNVPLAAIQPALRVIEGGSPQTA